MSLIILNQNIHNNNIPASLKMDKAGFLKQSQMVAPSYPQGTLSQIYDRIKETQFKTDT